MAPASQSIDEVTLKARINAGSEDPEDFRTLAAHLFSSGRTTEGSTLIEKALSELSLTNQQRASLSIDFANWLFKVGVGDDRVLELAQAGVSLLPDEMDCAELTALRIRGLSLLACCTSPDDYATAAESARLGLVYCQRLLASDPEDDLRALALYQETVLYQLLGEKEKVIQCCRRCLDVTSDPEHHLHCEIWMGIALQELGDLTRSKWALRRALKDIDTDRSQLSLVLFHLGLVELQEKNWTEARERFRQAIETKRANSCGEMYKSWESDFWMGVNAHFAQSCYELGQYQEAIAACNEVVALNRMDNPYHWNALVWLGWCHLNMGSYSQAENCFTEVLNSTQADTKERESASEGMQEVYSRFAESHYAAKEFAESALRYETLLSLNMKDNASRNYALLGLAESLVAVGKRRRARELYRDVLTSKAATAEQKRMASERLGANRWIAWLRSHRTG